MLDESDAAGARGRASDGCLEHGDDCDSRIRTLISYQKSFSSADQSTQMIFSPTDSTS